MKKKSPNKLLYVFPLEVSTIRIVLLILLTSFCFLMIKNFMLFHFIHLFKTLLTFQHKLWMMVYYNVHLFCVKRQNLQTPKLLNDPKFQLVIKHVKLLISMIYIVLRFCFSNHMYEPLKVEGGLSNMCNILGDSRFFWPKICKWIQNTWNIQPFMFKVFFYKLYDWNQNQKFYWECHYKCEYPFL
jgi:hypothetical protein